MASTLRTGTEKLILSVQDVEDDNRDSIGREISSLERLIATAVTDIASKINRKYVECVPDLVTTNKLLDTIRSTYSIVNHSVDSIANNVENMAKEMELNKKKLERLESIKDWKLKMHSLEEIELLIYLAERDETADQAFAERIGPALKTEVVTLRQSLTYMLNSFWDQIFSLREFNNKIILHLTASSNDALNEKLSAMDILNLIDAKIGKLSSALMHHFCKRLIAAKDPKTVICSDTSFLFMNTLYMHFMQNRMLDLFKSSGRNLGAIKVSGKNMVQLIDDKISNELVEL
ncbi:unnamed protein product, partial [Wuchereria bancrofti]